MLSFPKYKTPAREEEKEEERDGGEKQKGDRKKGHKGAHAQRTKKAIVQLRLFRLGARESWWRSDVRGFQSLCARLCLSVLQPGLSYRRAVTKSALRQMAQVRSRAELIAVGSGLPRYELHFHPACFSFFVFATFPSCWLSLFAFTTFPTCLIFFPFYSVFFRVRFECPDLHGLHI